jgi:hypothetical protein
MIKLALRRVVQLTGYDLVRIGRGRTYNRDGLYTNHNHDFATEPKFRAAYTRSVARTHKDARFCPGEWRTHIAIWAAQNALKHPGDFVECGVAFGFVSSAIMTYLDWNNLQEPHRFILFDNFTGLLPEQLSDEERRIGRADRYKSRPGGVYPANAEAQARANLGEFRNVEIVKGNVPEVLPQAKIERVAFLHLDMNVAMPEVEAFKYFWPKMVTGAPILFDDYAFVGYQAQRIALDEAAKALGTSIASLPTGQGLVLR